MDVSPILVVSETWLTKEQHSRIWTWSYYVLMKLLMEGKAFTGYLGFYSFLPCIVYIYYHSIALKSSECHLPNLSFLEWSHGNIIILDLIIINGCIHWIKRFSSLVLCTPTMSLVGYWVDTGQFDTWNNGFLWKTHILSPLFVLKWNKSEYEHNELCIFDF